MFRSLIFFFLAEFLHFVSVLKFLVDLSVCRGSDSPSESEDGSEGGSKDNNVEAQGSDRMHKNLGKIIILKFIACMLNECLIIVLLYSPACCSLAYVLIFYCLSVH